MTARVLTQGDWFGKDLVGVGYGRHPPGVKGAMNYVPTFLAAEDMKREM